MNNDTKRPETKPTQHMKTSKRKDRATQRQIGGKWWQRIGPKGQSAAECGSGKGSAGLLHSECLRFGLTTARPHGPWWCRKLGIASEDRQGKAAEGIAPPIQSVCGTAVDSGADWAPAGWVGMRPRRPLQDVREVTEVGGLET